MAVKLFKSEFLGHEKLSDRFFILKFKSQDALPPFKPGQFVAINIAGSVFRSYSIYSSPKSLPFWEIFLDSSPMGVGCKYLTSLKKGNTIKTTKPAGIFFLKSDGAKFVLMAVTGCGVAAVKPMIEKLIYSTKIHLLWGLRHEKDIVQQKLLKNWQKKYPNFSFEIILSKPKKSWKGRKGYVTEYYKNAIKENPKTKTSIYLCGGSNMVKDSLTEFDKLKIPKKRIYFEKFY